MSSKIVQIKPRFLDKPNAADYLSLSIKTFERKVAAGEIPGPHELSEQRVGWDIADLDRWADARPKSQKLPPPNTQRRNPTTNDSNG